jgi:hypothetical protein
MGAEGDAQGRGIATSLHSNSAKYAIAHMPIPLGDLGRCKLQARATVKRNAMKEPFRGVAAPRRYGRESIYS